MTLPPLALDMIIGLACMTALYVVAGWVAEAIDRSREP